MNEQNLPKLEIKDGGFFLTENFTYVFPNGKYVVVPKNYETNFASIPALGRVFISPIDPQIVVGALVHDFLTQEWGDTTKSFPPVITIVENGKYSTTTVTWAQAAWILREIMVEYKASIIKRQTVYLSVRLYGLLKKK